MSGQTAWAQAPALPADLVPVVTHRSLLGTHTWYRQTFRGLPVLDSYHVVHTGADGATTGIDDGRRAVPATLDTTAAFPRRRSSPGRPAGDRGAGGGGVEDRYRPTGQGRGLRSVLRCAR